MNFNNAGKAVLCALLLPAFASAADAPPHDGLNAALWTQTAVEFKGNARGMYRLAEIMLDRALEDKTWTAFPVEQGEDFGEKPPAVMLDVDETVLDNSAYAAWQIATGNSYSSKTWAPFVRTETSVPVPGSLEFIRYARKKGVRVFYVTNRKAPQEAATRKNLKALGYPIDEAAGEDVVLMKGEREEWGSKKGSRKRLIAEKYRVLIVVGDNFGDFTDEYKGSLEQRKKIYDRYADFWGTRWIVISNPTYGSWESAAFGGNWKLSAEERREMKIGAMDAWKGVD
jgi:acid phosphatase